jgi:folate-dependent phosphoribosylglycinamide formyltransferase PurN
VTLATIGKMSICFIGVRIEAFLALERYVHIDSVVTIEGSRVHRHCEKIGRTFQLAKRSERAHIFDFIYRQKVDMVFSAGFPFTLPAEILEGEALFINSHPSLLPAYKGNNAIKDAFKAGEPFMGITVHYMEEEVDAGALIVQESVSVRGLMVDQVYDVLFSVVEPMAITRSLEKIIKTDSADGISP